MIFLRVIFCLYFQWHHSHLKWWNDISHSILSLSRNEIFLLGGYYNHFQKHFLLKPSIYFLLKIIKHASKFQNMSGGFQALKFNFFFYRSCKHFIELEQGIETQQLTIQKKLYPISKNPKIGVQVFWGSILI